MPAVETRLCGHCGDRYVVGKAHECWVMLHEILQEKLEEDSK